MGEKTKIEWTQGGGTWNFARGCTKKGRECDNCYAMVVAHRFSAHGLPFEGLTRVIGGRPHWIGVARAAPEALTVPMRHKSGRKWFVNSMSDTFHPDLSQQLIDRAFAVMATATQHEFLVLTKEPLRMRDYLSDPEMPMRVAGELRLLLGGAWGGSDGPRYRRLIEEAADRIEQAPDRAFPLPNVAVGASMGTLDSVRKYLRPLQETPAVSRFISAEPLLEDISSELDMTGIDQLIVGGESSPRARPTHPIWVRRLRDLAAKMKVAFFFKQWGTYGPTRREGATHILDGKRYKQVEPLVLPLSEAGTIYSWGKASKLMVPLEPLKLMPNGEGLFLCEPFDKAAKRNNGRVLDGKVHDGYPQLRKVA